jgi:hypothetical protein
MQNEEMLQLASEFNSWWWPIYSDQRKIQMSDRVVETAFINYEKQWGVELTRKDPTISFNSLMDEFELGGYRFGSNSIELNAGIRNHPRGLLEVVGHEGTHCAQEAFRGLSKDALSGPTRAHYDALINDSSYVHVDVFGIQTQGMSNLQASVDHGTGEYAELRHAFYELGIGEREARIFEQECVDAFAQVSGKEQPYSPVASLEHYADVFKQHYGCEHLTNEEVFELMDCVQSNICNNITPTDPLEASVTYDFAALMYEQEPGFDMQRFQQIMDPEEKMARMQDAGIDLSCDGLDMVDQNDVSVDVVVDIDDLFVDKTPEIDIDELLVDNGMEVDIEELFQGDRLEIGLDRGDGLLGMDNLEFDVRFEGGFDGGSGMDAAEQAMEVVEEAAEAAMEAVEMVFKR